MLLLYWRKIDQIHWRWVQYGFNMGSIWVQYGFNIFNISSSLTLNIVLVRFNFGLVGNRPLVFGCLGIADRCSTSL